MSRPTPRRAAGRRGGCRTKLARFRPDVVWSSPLQRASVVAERASRLARVPLRVDQRLIELDFGQAHGLTWEEITEAGIEFNYRSVDEPVAPGGESRGELESQRRARASTRCAPLGAGMWSSRTPE